MSSWFDKLNTNNADCNDNVNVQIVLTICVWPQCGDCYLFIIFHLIIRYFTKLQKTKKTNPDISKWLWSNKALCESGVTCLWLLQCQEVKKKQKGTHLIGGKCQNTRCSVIGEVNKHMIIGSTARKMRTKLTGTKKKKKKKYINQIYCCLATRSLLPVFFNHLPLQHFSRATFDFWGITLQHCQEVFWGNILQ